jgi:DNA-binding NarL/FixJ family response regulator
VFKDANAHDLSQPSKGSRGHTLTLLKSDASQNLIAAIEALASHRPFFTGKVSEALLDLFVAEQSTEETLTRRERQILRLIADGHTNRAAARVLGVSLKTIETHRDKILKKLNLHSTAALVRYAVRNKIIEP